MPHRGLNIILCLFILVASGASLSAAPPSALSGGAIPDDARLGSLRTLDDYFPFKKVDSTDAWHTRAEQIRRQVLVSNGLWPPPTKTPLNAVIHSPVERDDYTVSRVYFESFPGHYVTGSLYRPKPHVTARKDALPAVLSPHGHWGGGRFHAHSYTQIRREIAEGGERFLDCGRFPLQARCVQLARMGCIVFHYDMVGYADSVQIDHRPGVRSHMTGDENWGFFSPEAEGQLINMMGLQTWNSVRALDFVLSLDDVDEARIGVTGASGGGTQTMLLTAIDDRVHVSVPCVMVSTSMQGGCTCENAPYLRIDAGNIDVAACAAPRPLGMTAADDWTVELASKGFPDLLGLYTMLGHPNRVSAGINTHFGHNYNAVSRVYMYGVMNEHFGLGFEAPVLEEEFVPLSSEELTVWTGGDHARPSGEQAGDSHERSLVRVWAEDAAEQIAAARENAEEYDRIVGGGWRTILGPALQEIGDVAIEMSEEQAAAEDGLLTGLIVGGESGQRLPFLFLTPTEEPNHELVIWLTDRGKAGILDEQDRPIAAVQRLMDAGYSVAGVDLIGQGEFVPDGDRIEQARLHTRGEQAWQTAACYTFGYNRPLFAQRVQDVLATIAAAKSSEHPATKVHVVGVGREAGPVALAARFQAGDAVAKTAVQTDGFRFDKITRIDDPMFVPGAVRYDGVEGLRKLAGDAVQFDDGTLADDSHALSLVDWLMQN